MGEDGEFLGSFSVCTDITESRRAEKALQASEARFKQFAEHLPGYLFMKDVDGRYAYVNRPDQVDDGLAHREWVGKTAQELWSGDLPDVLQKHGEQALATGLSDSIDKWETPEGSRYMHRIYFPIGDVAGEGKEMVAGLSLDVTGQVLAEQEVRRKAEQLQRTVEGAVHAMSHVV